MNALIRGQKGFYGLAPRRTAKSIRCNLNTNTSINTSNTWSHKSTKCKVDSLIHHPALSPFYRNGSIGLPAASSECSSVWSSTHLYIDAITNPSPLYSVNYITGVGAIRHFSLSASRFEQASSKIEETVKKIQEKEKEKDLPKNTELAAAPAKAVVKKSIKQRVWEELVHYYHGFRLLFIDINVARKLLGKVLRGKTLTRREYMLLIRTTGDVFRLVPFSVFLIVPFMEFLLPVFIKFFPGMLPSTFETAKDAEDKARKNLKVKLEMAKFLQKTLDEMDVSNKDHKSEEAKEFIEFFNKLRTAGERATPEEILRFSKLFEDEITLDSLSRQQLSAICKVLEVSTLGTSNLLRFQLRMKLRSLAADDRMIQKEGVDSLTLEELQAASRARGMRSYGLSEDQLKKQIIEWINLSLNEKVPPSLLLLSRAMLLPEDVPTTDKLKASISVLSDAAAVQTKAAIGEREGKIDNKTKIEIIRDEQRKIKEELEELKEVEKDEKVVAEKAAEILADAAPIIIDTLAATPISTKDIEVVSDAIGAIAAQKKTLLVEKEEIKDLKEEIADYKEDVEELNMISKQSDSGTKIKESAASKMLLKKVDSMITKLDKTLDDLEKKEAKSQENLKVAGAEEPSQKTELVQIEEIINAIRKMQKIPDESKLEQISKILGKIDVDKDGHLKVDDVLKVVEAFGKDSVDLTEKQLDELMELISKEEHLENEEKIEKALAKSKEERELSKAAAAAAEELTDEKTKILTDSCEQKPVAATSKVSGDETQKIKSPTKQIDERINQTIIQSATEAAERQKDKILPLTGSTDVPKTPQLPTSAGTSASSSNPKDKML